MHVHIAQFNTEHCLRLQLNVSPCWRATINSSKQHAGINRLAIDQLIFTQKHLMGCVRRIVLAKVDPRAGGVCRFTDVIGSAEDAVCAGQVGCASQDHEVCWATWNVKWIIWLERDEHGSGAALVD